MQGVLRPSEESNYSKYSKIIYESVRDVLRKTTPINKAINIINNFSNGKY